jgi:large subunit ribosomal protein L13
MNMNRVFFLRKEDSKPRWRVIDASNKVVGRLATEIADILRGKDRAQYTPHTDSGDYVVVINAEKVTFTGDKMQDKEYVWYTNWIGGQKKLTASQMMAKDPTHVIFHAVKGMLGKKKLSNAQLKKLLIYKGAEHPHGAQIKGHGVVATERA